MPADKLRITLAGSELVVEEGTTAGLALADRDPEAKPIAARVNGQLRDLAWPLADGDRVEPVAIDSADGLNILRHSTAHVLAQAVQDLFPQAKLGIGPPIENGFYYDFDVPEAFTPEDLKKIEQQMRQIVRQGQRLQPPGGERRRCPPRAGRRAVQAGADRPEGQRRAGRFRGRRCRARRLWRVRRGRRAGAHHLRQPRCSLAGAALEGPVPRPAPADDQADTRRSS